MKRRNFLKAGIAVFSGVGIKNNIQWENAETTNSKKPNFLDNGYSGKSGMVLVEAESFEDYGGWTLDGQFVDQMGSSYLMAHGIGNPVKNARTTVALPETGDYKVFVRTMNWVPGFLPGEFEIHIAGMELKGFLKPQDGREWKWYEAGSFRADNHKVDITLKDMTGFNGRCDAILLVKDARQDFMPPNNPKQLADFRDKLLNNSKISEDQGNFDMVVIGGGFSGICSSVAAARLGLKVALIQNRPVLGGVASSEIKVNPIGKTNFPPYPKNAEIVNELLHPGAQKSYTNLSETDKKRMNVVTKEKNISLFLDTHASSVETRKNRITSVSAINLKTNKKYKFQAPLFVDCTGDGTIGYLANAEYRIGRESRQEFNESLAPQEADTFLMGNTQYWYAREMENESGFPSCPWALPIETEEMYKVPEPKWPMTLVPGIIASAAWNWESGFTRNNIKEAEYIRDYNLRAIYGVWDFLKNKSPEKEKYAKGNLEWVAYTLGKRESRRLMGEVILNQNDIMKQKSFPDACVMTTWYFDIHYPHPSNSKYFPGEEFRSIAYDDPNWDIYGKDFPGHYIEIDPYRIPFRCFYSKNIHNLMMAGRNISVSHVALASTRVMKTCGMMGTVVGRAAYILKKYGDDPDAIYTKHLEEFKSLLKNPEIFEK